MKHAAVFAGPANTMTLRRLSTTERHESCPVSHLVHATYLLWFLLSSVKVEIGCLENLRNERMWRPAQSHRAPGLAPSSLAQRGMYSPQLVEGRWVKRIPGRPGGQASFLRTCGGWASGIFSGWFLACVLRSPGAVPSRLAYTQELVPVFPVTQTVGSGLLWREGRQLCLQYF